MIGSYKKEVILTWFGRSSLVTSLMVRMAWVTVLSRSLHNFIEEKNGESYRGQPKCRPGTRLNKRLYLWVWCDTMRTCSQNGVKILYSFETRVLIPSLNNTHLSNNWCLSTFPRFPFLGLGGAVHRHRRRHSRLARARAGVFDPAIDLPLSAMNSRPPGRHSAWVLGRNRKFYHLLSARNRLDTVSRGTYASHSLRRWRRIASRLRLSLLAFFSALSNLAWSFR